MKPIRFVPFVQGNPKIYGGLVELSKDESSRLRAERDI
jgi:hypothetical protein